MKKRGTTKATGRDYTYDKAYAAREEQKKRRAQRNKARRKAIKAGRVRKGDGKDVDHGKPTRRGKLGSKTTVKTASRNRANNGHRKGEKRRR